MIICGTLAGWQTGRLQLVTQGATTRHTPTPMVRMQCVSSLKNLIKLIALLLFCSPTNHFLTCHGGISIQIIKSSWTFLCTAAVDAMECRHGVVGDSKAN